MGLATYLLSGVLFYWLGNSVNLVYRALFASFVMFVFNKLESRTFKLKESSKEYVIRNYRIIAETALLSVDIYFGVSYGFWIIAIERFLDLILFVGPLAILCFQHRDTLIPLAGQLMKTVEALTQAQKTRGVSQTPQRRKLAFDD